MPAGWVLLLFVGLGPGAVTMTLFTYSVPRLGASSFAILANTELVVVVSIGVLVLGEALTAWRAIGGALIVAGVVTHALARRPAPLPASERGPAHIAADARRRRRRPPASVRLDRQVEMRERAVDVRPARPAAPARI